MKKFYTPFILTAFFLAFAACVTQKKKEDVGAVGKAYHNMTARYNGYYNADLLLQESMATLDQQYQDNYNQLLPVYKYVAAENPKAVAGQLDKAIEKISVVVNLHRVSHWTDDCYLLMGRALYLKQDYEAAEEALEFLTGEYDPKEVAKREAKMKAKKGKKKAVKKGKAPAKSATDEGDGEEEEVKLSKKEKERLAKKKRKQREKEKKQRIKDSRKKRKGGKSSAKGKEEKSEEPVKKEKTDRKKKEEPKKEVKEEETQPAPGSIRLGDMETNVTESGEEQKSYFMKHRPAYQEGVLWLARTYIERQNFTNAERLIEQLEKSPSTFNDVNREVAIAKAHFFIRQKMYDKAIEPLDMAIEKSNDRPMKARLNFILGQIHQKAGRGQQAYAAFERVLKNQPVYDMEFSARLNLATAGVNAPEESARQLERMLKEDKNQDFLDQIYFALAKIDLAKGDKKAAIANLELSVKNNTSNAFQKAESYLMLGDLYFEDENFVKAKENYDQALSALPQSDERYSRVSKLAANLEGIAENLKIIALQDSLLRISRMSDEERKELAGKIKKQQDEEKLRQLKEQAEMAQSKADKAGGPAPGLDPSKLSNFWAYNDREVKDGIRDFQRKWGTRALEDNWRRSNKQSLTPEGEPIAEETKQSSRELSQEDIDQIFKDVPDSPEKIALANRQVENAMFNLGQLYRDRLGNYSKSIETMEKLLERYPETQYQLDALYYCYLAAKDMNNDVKAQYYYDKIVKGYPHTTYAQILSDPNFLKNFADKEKKLNNYYDETYDAFERRQYQLAYERIGKVGELFGGTNKLQPRFALLSAMCIGNIQGKPSYVEALKDVIAKYGDQPEATRAKEILRLLGEETASGPGQKRDLPGSPGQVGNYRVTDDQLHYVLVIFKKDISLNDAKVVISDYNTKYHNLQKLRMNNIYLGEGENKFPLIAIRRFTDKKEAMDYFNTIPKNKQDFLDPVKYEHEVFPISQDNYRELLKEKNIDQYRVFYQANYLK